MEKCDCSGCGVPLMGDEPHCSKCASPMKCEGETCSCQCGNAASCSEIKCDACLEVQA